MSSESNVSRLSQNSAQPDAESFNDKKLFSSVQEIFYFETYFEMVG